VKLCKAQGVAAAAAAIAAGGVSAPAAAAAAGPPQVAHGDLQLLGPNGHSVHRESECSASAGYRQRRLECP